MTELEKIKETISNHGYEYLDLIGKGGFSCVYLCYSRKYNQNFAIKKAIKHKCTEYEYNTLVSLSHSYIIKLYDSFEDDESQYFVLEYCQNGTIRQKGVLQFDQFVFYAKQILEAIAYCHSNQIAHRDIKPDNIFLDQYDHIKLADFGMAKQFENQKRSNEMCGSFKFFSPEMVEEQEICPFKADIWALGITFFYMMTGCYPFESTSIEEMKRLISYGEINFKNHSVDPRIQFMIKKMTEKNPKLRPSAKKLLSNPIFSQNKSLKTSFLFKQYHKYPLRPIIAQSNSFTFDINQQDSDNDKDQNISLSSIHSYKKVSFYRPNHRIDCHFLNPKP
ncbi:hypothetical protein M9Y10_025301 [Tritrichomonas musculus]|uniref:Protein kinase domain-containing protein n=1 Tax=Tritrichomonas musculus TaxID=1915356 RepID=A0ABR2HA44_9EUKA